MLPPERDLFGKAIRSSARRSKYEIGLDRYDRDTRSERAKRLRWVDRAIPRRLLVGGPYETMLVFREAKDCYVAGHPIAALLLATAFLEHWMAGFVTEHGHAAEAKRGLAACVQAARNHQLLPESVLRKLDLLRVHRNPFVHLKPIEHRYNVHWRMSQARVSPADILDEDARQALTLMFTIGLYVRSSLRRPPIL